ncbi:MAG: amino acid adenylation domain-containing protein, partial [Methylococcaceae bacterium]
MQEVTAKNVDDQQKRAKLLSLYKNNLAPGHAIPLRETPTLAPLSNAQEPLWLLSQLEPENPIYNVAGAVEFEGLLNCAALAQSVNQVVRRHEILRSSFSRESAGVVQRVAEFNPISLPTVDLSQLPEAAITRCFQNCADRFIRAPFNLALPQPIRALLLRLAPQKHRLLIALHHIVSDRWSVNVFMQEVATLYSDLSAGQPSKLPALSLHYGDYATWQRQQNNADDKLLPYWQQKLQAHTALLRLPIDRPRPAMPSYSGGLYRFNLSMELSLAIKQVARRHNASLFMVLASALTILLQRYSASQDIAMGYTAAGRQQAQTTPLIGFFVNTLVLRSQLNSAMRFTELLQQIRGQALLDQDYQDVSYGQLLAAVDNLKPSMRTPLFQVMLTVQNAPAQDLAWPGLQVSPVGLESRVAQFDLTFLVEENNAQLDISIEYSNDLFNPATLPRIASHFGNLLKGIVEHDNLPLGRYLLLSEPERQMLVTGWNIPTLTPSKNPPENLLALIDQQVQSKPDKDALIIGESIINYRVLAARANQLAHHLISLGAKPETRIGVCAERSLELIIGLLAVLKAGAAYVPLDPSYPQERLNFICQDAGVQILLSQTALAQRLHTNGAVAVSLDGDFKNYPPTTPVCLAQPVNTAYIIYTSGSTGQPKGVSVSHSNLWYSTQARNAYYQGPPACFLLLSSFAFDSSVAGIFWTLCGGGGLCLPLPEQAQDPAALRALIKQHQVSHLLTLPSFYSAIANGNHVQALTSLSHVIVAGEACLSELANTHHRRYPHVKLFNEYGPTEATVWSTVYESTGAETLPVLPIGLPINCATVYVLDAYLQPVPIGVAGELYIGGLAITQGYINRPALTAQQFLPNPYAMDGSRLYRSGDLVRRLADGNLEFLGRIDQQIKIRGYRIELGEIEARLLCHSAVHSAVVIAREDVPGNKRLVAYVQAEERVDASELRHFLAESLPEFMLPSAFVCLEAFPLTANGKLNREALPTPEQVVEPDAAFLAPVSAAEIALAQLWQALLGVERVGRYDHFFELGGHSLMAITLIEQLQQNGYEADVVNIFAHPVLTDMAASLTDRPRDQRMLAPANLITADSLQITPALLPLVTLNQQQIDSLVDSVTGGVSNIQDIYPLAPLQEGILFHHMLNPEHDTYVKRVVLRFKTRGSLDKFLAALQQVIDRHDILRTSFHWQGLPEALQIVHREARLPVFELDFPGSNNCYQEFIKQTEPQRLPMNLQSPPLFKAYITAEQPGGQYLLSLINHHLVDDNYTLQLILSEINLILKAQTASLPASVPYRNLVAQINQSQTEQHEAYFRGLLSEITEPTAPFGILGTLANGQSINEAKTYLEPVLSQKLYAYARELGTTPALLFHVAWAQVLAQCCGRDEVVFGTVLYGRLQAAGAAGNALGVYINTLPVCLKLGKRSIREVIAESSKRLQELLDHEQASLALAQRCSKVGGVLPLFTSLMNFRHSHLVDDSMAELFSRDEVELLSTEDQTNYPITISVDDIGQQFVLTAQCHEGLEPERLVHYLATALQSLVQALQADPAQAASQLNILPE